MVFISVSYHACKCRHGSSLTPMLDIINFNLSLPYPSPVFRTLLELDIFSLRRKSFLIFLRVGFDICDMIVVCSPFSGASNFSILLYPVYLSVLFKLILVQQYNTYWIVIAITYCILWGALWLHDIIAGLVSCILTMINLLYAHMRTCVLRL